MTLLSEYAITPDVFDPASYSSPEVCQVRIEALKEVLLNEAVVRDLRDGAWSALFSGPHRAWHRLAIELLGKLKNQNRLSKALPAQPVAPVTDEHWCGEAVASHARTPLRGILASKHIADRFNAEPRVSSIEKLAAATWWTSRSPSVRLARTHANYMSHLHLVLQCSNSLVFIDPYLDPLAVNYQNFIGMLTAAKRVRLPPTIEVHRSWRLDMDKNAERPTLAEWRARFQRWEEPLVDAGLTVEVFIRGDFHDRYLISDLVGISVPYGFDTTNDSRTLTTWNRLGRNDRDDVEREFDRSGMRRSLVHNFRVGCQGDTTST